MAEAPFDPELAQVINEYIEHRLTFYELCDWMEQGQRWLDYLAFNVDRDSPESDIVAEVMLCLWAHYDHNLCPEAEAYQRISEEWKRIQEALHG